MPNNDPQGCLALPQHQTTPGSLKEPQAPQTPQASPLMDIKSYFPSLEIFKLHCRSDPKLTPNVQLVYRLLVETANRHYWASDFPCSDQWLADVSHLPLRTIQRAKLILQHQGFIDFFSAKPTKYTIYNATAQKWRTSWHETPTPHTPQDNTCIQKIQYKKKEKFQKKEGLANAAATRNHGADGAGANLSEDQLAALRELEKIRRTRRRD